MPRTKRTTPSGHGEVLTQPDYDTWAALMRASADAASSWHFTVAGMPASDLRSLARRESVERAQAFSRRLGVPVAEAPARPEWIVMTGHQPELYHPGVWIKDFLLQRLSDESGATAIDLVVDTDGFDTVGMHSPCLQPEVRVCSAYLAVGTGTGCYGCAGVPSAGAIEDFCAAGGANLEKLPAPALGHHFARFCTELRGAAGDAENLAELVTFARRRYEAVARTDYLELPVSSMSGSRAFAAFVVHIALDAPAFVHAYNAALAAYRSRTGTRSSAQPFPDLESVGDLVELPFWQLGRDGRSGLWVRGGDSPALVVDGVAVCDLSGGADAALERLRSSGIRLAPKALSLTMFARLFVADLFIHGVGGGRYDQVTDDVARRYFGVEMPAFTVASMTMYLPLGARVVGEGEIEALAMALNRLRHNPDQMLDEVDFDTEDERERANALARDKADAVVAIAVPGADKKALGTRIRDVNAELAALLAPVEEEMRAELAQLQQLQEATGILTDRTYPFCLWDPCEVADKAR